MSEKTKITVEIECEGDYCGECLIRDANYCAAFIFWLDGENRDYIRCPACITAQSECERRNEKGGE